MSDRRPHGSHLSTPPKLGEISHVNLMRAGINIVSAGS